MSGLECDERGELDLARLAKLHRARALRVALELLQLGIVLGRDGSHREKQEACRREKKAPPHLGRFLEFPLEKRLLYCQVSKVDR